jgi:predicted CoA-binding protein
MLLLSSVFVSSKALSVVRPHVLKKVVRNLSMSSASTIDHFFNFKQFAVVGASNDREKFGNKVLRCYVKHGKQAIPVHPKEKEVEGLKASSSLTALLSDHSVLPTETGVSIITAPKVTKATIQEGLQLGYKAFFLQPGTVDESVREVMRDGTAQSGAVFIEGCVLVELGC